MNSKILDKYFTDNQIAAIKGITLGGLRNKIYLRKTDDLPPFKIDNRIRLYSKSEVRKWLQRIHKDNPDMVDSLMQDGERATPGSRFRAAEAEAA